MKRKKLYLIGAIVTILLLGAVTTIGVMASPLKATGCFPDTNGHWAEAFICWMNEYGIVGGYPDGEFKPGNNVSRAEVSVMIQNTSKLVRGEGTEFDGSGGMFFGPAGTIEPDNSGTFATVTIDAPGDGALLINGSINLDCMGAIALPGSCTASVGNTYIVVDGTRYNRMSYTIDGGDSSVSGGGWNNSHSTFVAVNSGSHTVELEVANSSGSSGSTKVWTGGINVLFVPFDGSGNVP
jgi:hypothetical protein